MKISALPLEALLSKLSNNSTGFNQALAAVAPSYNIKPFTLSFPATVYSANTHSVLFVKMAPDEIVSFGATDKSKLCIYVDSADNLNLEKPRSFAGLVKVALDFHLQWQSNDLKQVFEPYSLAVEDALSSVIQLVTVQNWGGGVVYNGAFSAVRGPVIAPPEGQGSLRQMLGFRLSFMVSV